MGVNKVVINNITQVDLSSDTVTPETLAEGYTAHDRDGEAIVGTMSGDSELLLVLTGIKGSASSLNINKNLSDFPDYQKWKLEDFTVVANDGASISLTFSRTCNSCYYAPPKVTAYNPETGDITIYAGCLTGVSTSGAYPRTYMTSKVYVATAKKGDNT